MACAGAKGLEVAFVLCVILGFASLLPSDRVDSDMMASIAGLITYSIVRTLGRVLDGERGGCKFAAMGGLGPSSTWKCWTRAFPSTGWWGRSR